MERIITAAVEEFKVKLADAIYDIMVDECFIDKCDTERNQIIKMLTEAKYHANKKRLVINTNSYLMSTITKVLGHIAVDFHRYIDNIYFEAKPTNHRTKFDMNIGLDLYIPNVVEIFYFEKAKLKIDA